MKLKSCVSLALVWVLTSPLHANAGEGREQWTLIALAGNYASGWIDGFAREGTRELGHQFTKWRAHALWRFGLISMDEYLLTRTSCSVIECSFATSPKDVACWNGYIAGKSSVRLVRREARYLFNPKARIEDERITAAIWEYVEQAKRPSETSDP